MTLRIYSPAPPSTRLHALNVILGDRLRQAGIANEVVAVPLPDAVNEICDLPVDLRALHLPIMTTVDLLPSVRGTGPDWHRYARKNTDLKLLASLYDVAFGVSVFDSAITAPEGLRGHRIHCPPRPSSVRLMTESLLFDAWGFAGDIDLVDSRPADLQPLIEAGTLTGTTWNITSLEGDSGSVPNIGDPRARFLPLDDAAIERLNGNRDTPFGTCHVGGVPLLAFRQGIAVWDETPAGICDGILDVLSKPGAPFFSRPGDLADWPGIDDSRLHPSLLGRR